MGRFRKKVIPPLAVAIVVLGAALWVGLSGRSRPLALGPPIDVSRAVDLAAVLARSGTADGEARSDDVIVRGTVGEVCRSSGCWFVLTQSDGGELRELYVDLKSGAGFTVPPDISGRSAAVAGRLVGDWPDVRLAARSVVVSPSERRP